MMTPLLIYTDTGRIPVRTSLCCEMSLLWDVKSLHIIRSMSSMLFQVTFSMTLGGSRHVGQLKVCTPPAPLSRPCLMLSFIFLIGETGVGCHTGWLSHCQYLIRWMAVPCVDLHVTCA